MTNHALCQGIKQWAFTTKFSSRSSPLSNHIILSVESELEIYSRGPLARTVALGMHKPLYRGVTDFKGKDLLMSSRTAPLPNSLRMGQSYERNLSVGQ